MAGAGMFSKDNSTAEAGTHRRESREEIEEGLRQAYLQGRSETRPFSFKEMIGELIGDEEMQAEARASYARVEPHEDFFPCR